jgi:hypothetical protein
MSRFSAHKSGQAVKTLFSDFVGPYVFQEPTASLKVYALVVKKAFHQKITTQRISQILKEEDITHVTR